MQFPTAEHGIVGLPRNSGHNPLRCRFGGTRGLRGGAYQALNNPKALKAYASAPCWYHGAGAFFLPAQVVGESRM